MLPGRWIGVLSWLMLGVAGGVAAAQDQAPAPQPERVITVQITCSKTGTPMPRDVKAPADRIAFQLVGHEVAWKVDDKTCATAADLLAELNRCYEDHQHWVPDPEHPGVNRPKPVLITAGKGVAWSDVTMTLDQAARARFPDRRPPGASHWMLLVAKAPSKPQPPAGELIPPAMTFQEPDEPPPGTWRPEFDVLQDGRVRFEKQIVFDPNKKPVDRSSLAAAFQQLGEKARQQKLISRHQVDGREREVANAPILIRADKWTGSEHVQTLLECAAAAEPLFWKIDLSVVEDANAETEFVGAHGGK